MRNASKCLISCNLPDEAIQFLHLDLLEEHVKGWTCFLREKIKHALKNKISMKILRLDALYEICVFRPILEQSPTSKLESRGKSSPLLHFPTAMYYSSRLLVFKTLILVSKRRKRDLF